MKKGKRNKPKLVNCSPKDVFRALRKLGDFSIKEGSNHSVIIHNPSNKKSTIPRHTPIDRGLLKDFVKSYLMEELGYSKKEIYRHLWC